AREAPSSYREHGPRRPFPWGSKRGSSVLHRANAYVQRGWSRQPDGGLRRSGTVPAIVGNGASEGTSLSRETIDSSNPSVYGWSGCAKRSPTGASSTILPAYMTATRSHRSAITAT